jgi:hypothetical protein
MSVAMATDWRPIGDRLATDRRPTASKKFEHRVVFEDFGEAFSKFSNTSFHY